MHRAIGRAFRDNVTETHDDRSRKKRHTARSLITKEHSQNRAPNGSGSSVLLRFPFEL